MSSLRSFKQKLSSVMRHWESGEYDHALAEVESLREAWPGNSHLHVLWASLVQLQDEPENTLQEAKQALQLAVELDRTSPAASIELGHFLDVVEDKAGPAAKAFAEGVALARRSLIDGLIGRAKALHQLDKHEEVFACLLELLQLTQFEPEAKVNKAGEASPDIILESPTGRAYVFQLKGPSAERIEEILDEVRAHRSV
jgi:tetratricopeptide (TPR) repeat protein